MTPNRALQKKAMATLTVFLLILSPLVTLIPRTQGEGSGDYPAPESGDWVIDRQTNVTDEIIYLNGDIAVNNGGTLHLENVTIIINSTSSGEFSININNGGILFLYNSTVDRGTGFNYGFHVYDGGKIRIENSEVIHCGYNSWNYYGLTLYGNDAVVRNNLFTKCYIGIYSYVAQGHEITGNTFENNTHVALYLHTVSYSQIADNVFHRNNYGMFLHVLSNSSIKNNEVKNNTEKAKNHGIELRYSENVELKFNIVNNTNYALYVHHCNDIIIRENKAMNSTYGIVLQFSDNVNIYGDMYMFNYMGAHISYSNSNLTVENVDSGFNANYAIYVYDAVESTFRNNELHNSTVYHGILFSECKDIDVLDTSIYGIPSNGLWLQNSNNFSLSGNEIIDSNIGYYLLNSNDTVFLEGMVRNNNYGVYLDSSARNKLINSSSEQSSNNDLYIKGTTTGTTFLNTNFETTHFENPDIRLTVKNFLRIEVEGRTGPISDVDVEIYESLTGRVIYSTEYYGGTDEKTDSSGMIDWLKATHAFINQSKAVYNSVRIRINDHGIYEEERYVSVDQNRHELFSKDALTVDQEGFGDYTTIQGAIDASSEDDIILVASGNYSENLVIDKKLRIFGKGGNVIVNANGEAGILTQAQTTLSNISVVNSSVDIDVQGNTTVYNLTYDTTNLEPTHYLAVGYYLDLRLVDEKSNPIPGANVTIQNLLLPDKQFFSNPQGFVRNIPLLENANTSTNNWNLNPYYLNATKEYYNSSATFQIHENSEYELVLTRHGQFGSSLAVGDINGDGFEDYVVGAPKDNRNGNDAGTVFIYYGPRQEVDTLRAIDADTEITGEQAGSLFGTSMDIGDTNGDGLQDLVIGSPTYNNTNINGIKGLYYNGDDFTNFEYERIDDNINFPWGNDNPGGLGNRFSVIWEGFLNVEREDNYVFHIEHDDGVDIYIDGREIFSRDSWSPDEESTETIHLAKGMHSIYIEFRETGGGAELILKWSSPNMEKKIIPQEHFFTSDEQLVGNGAVYVFSGEIFENKMDAKPSQALRIDGERNGFGKSVHFNEMDGNDYEDLIVEYNGGTVLNYGIPMIARKTFENEPMLGNEWGPVIKDNGGDMYLSGDGELVIDTMDDGASKAYSMSEDKFLGDFSLKVKVEKGSSAAFLEAVDFKVQPDDNISTQEDGTLFSLRANGEIYYYPVRGGDIQSGGSPGNDESYVMEVFVTDNYSHLKVVVDDEVEVDTNLTDWHPVYLKVGDSTNFGAAEIKLMDFSPVMTGTELAGVDKLHYLNNSNGMLAMGIFGETYIMEPNEKNFFVTDMITENGPPGTHNSTEFKNGLTLYPYDFTQIVANGDFDDGWNNWTQTENVRDKNNGHWEINTETHGDWHVYQGSTAGLGPDGDVGSETNNDGKLVSDEFELPENVDFIDMWCHAKWWSFETTDDNYQDDYDDMIVFGVFDNETETIIDQIVYRKPPEDGEEDGRIQLDVTGYAGTEMYIFMEITNNYRQYDDGLAQMDNIRGAKRDENLTGTFTSELMELNRTFTSFIPSWEILDNGGNISFMYRTNESDSWKDMPEGITIIPEERTEFQYQVKLEGMKDNPFPVLQAFNMTFFGNAPEKLAEGDPVNLENIIQEHTLGVIHGNKLSAYDGEDIEFNITSLQNITAVSITEDIDNNGIRDIVVSSDNTAYVFLLNGEADIDVSEANYSFAGEPGYGAVLEKNLVASPFENNNDGRVYVLSKHTTNLAILGSNLANNGLIYPQTNKTILATLKNTGFEKMENVDLSLEITAPGYSYNDLITLTLEPGEEKDYSFLWDIPAEEGVRYHLRFYLETDMHSFDNELNLNVSARSHKIQIGTEKNYDAVVVNDTAEFHAVLTNKGTLGTDSVSFRMSLPGDWDWWLSKDGLNFSTLDVADSEGFDIFVKANTTQLGQYGIKLTAVSENETTNSILELSTHVVDRDLTANSITFLREDGKEGIPIHEENTTVMVEMENLGVQDAGSFNTALYVDEELVKEKSFSGIDGNSVANISFNIVLTEGAHEVRLMVDNKDIIREYNEENNVISVSTEVKSDISSSPYLVVAHVTDLDGIALENVKVKLSSGGNVLENLTNENGVTHLSLESYPEGESYKVEAETGDLYAAEMIRVYSQDASANVELVVGRYSLRASTGETDKDILPNGTQEYNLNIRNTGDFNDTYHVSVIGVPEDWEYNLTGDHLEDGNISIGKNEQVNLVLNLESWKYAPGHERYEISVKLQSQTSPNSFTEITTRTTVLTVDNIYLETGHLQETGSPGDPISYMITVRNEGNTERDIIPMVEGVKNYSSLSKNKVSVEPGDEETFWFQVELPNQPKGTIFNHRVFGLISGVGKTNMLNFSTTIGKNKNVKRFQLEIDDSMLYVTNTGNVDEDLSLDIAFDDQEYGEVDYEPGLLELKMGETARVELDVKMLEMNIKAGSLIPLDIRMMNGTNTFTPENTIYYRVHEINNLSLNTGNLTIPTTSGLILDIPVLVSHMGNTDDSPVYFSGTNTGEERLQVPSSITLDRFDEKVVKFRLMIPKDSRGTEIVTMSASMGETVVAINVTVEIDVYRELIFEQGSVKSENGNSRYTLNLYNYGDLNETVHIETNCGELDLEYSNIQSNGGKAQFHLYIPEENAGYPDSIIVTAHPDVADGISTNITLTPPPTSEIILLSTSPLTAVEPVRLSASGNYSEYKWILDSRSIISRELEYEFEMSGSHVVELYVTDSRGLRTKYTKTVELENIPPQIDTSSFVTGIQGESMEFEAANSFDPDGDIENYIWTINSLEFEGPSISYTFNESGDFNVTLTLVDNRGGENSTTIPVTVIPSDKGKTESVEKQKLDIEIFGLTSVILLAAIGIIGFMYFMFHKNEETLLKKLLVLESLTVKKAVHAAEKSELKEKNCPECGAVVPGKFKFCNKCGATLKASQPETGEARKCPECSALVQRKFNFCNKCGAPMEVPEVKE